MKIGLKDNNLGLELNMNYICKDTIKKRKAIYGNNFPQIALLQNKYDEQVYRESIRNTFFIKKWFLILQYKLFNKKIKPEYVAMNLAILKKVRIDFIKSKLQEFRNNPRFNDYDIQIQIKDLNSGLEDSQKDMMNYLWIALNYEEYESL